MQHETITIEKHLSKHRMARWSQSSRDSAIRVFGGFEGPASRWIQESVRNDLSALAGWVKGLRGSNGQVAAGDQTISL